MLVNRSLKNAPDCSSLVDKRIDASTHSNGEILHACDATAIAPEKYINVMKQR